MAERAKAPAKKSRKGGKIKSRGTVAELPKSAKRKPGIGHNGGGPSDELYARHWEKIESTSKAAEKAKEAYDQAKGVHQAAYKQAKQDGCDTDAIRLLRKLHKQDQGVVTMMYSNVARVARIVGSPYGPEQLGLFDNMESPAGSPKVDANLQGQMAGKQGEPRDNNPFSPGSDDYQTWDDGWMTGQKMIAEGMRPEGSAVN